MKDISLFLGLAITLGLGIWNAKMNYNTSRRTTFINTVTSQRIKSSEQLRQDISSFCGLTYNWSVSNMEGKPEEQEIIKEIDRLRHVIRLRLNPQGEYDKTIESLIYEIPKYTHHVHEDKLKEKINELIIATQHLLKIEWDKVKLESTQNDIY